MPERQQDPSSDSTLTSDRRRLLIGGVAGAAAWAAPSIIGLDAAAALVSCMPGTLDWDSLVTGSVYTTSVVNGVSVTLTVAPLASPPTTLLATNRTIRASPNGSFNQKALQFQQLPNAIGIGQDVTFTFGAPVSNVVFTFYDIDNLVGGWGDRIRMFTTGYTSASSGTVIGNGTVGNLFRNSQLNNNATDGSSAGNLTLTYAGPITSFAFRYTNAVNFGGGNQRIGVSDMSWIC